MAGPPELVKTMAEALGMPATTLTVYDRCLSEAGLRSKHGRGRGTSTVTARDAAHLLTAVLASPLVKDSVQSVERYAATRARGSEPGGGFAKLGIAELGIAELAALTERSSFIDGLEALFAAVASGSLRAALGLPRQDADRPLIAVAPLITVMATTPATIGEIRLGGVRRKTAAVLYALPEPDGDGDGDGGTDGRPAQTFEAVVERYRADTDLEQQRRVSTRTIILVGELLADERRAS